MIVEYLKTQHKLFVLDYLHCLAGEVRIVVVCKQGLPKFLTLTSVNAFVTSTTLL